MVSEGFGGADGKAMDSQTIVLMVSGSIPSCDMLFLVA